MFRGVELIEIGGCTHSGNHLLSGSHGEQGTGLTTLTEYEGDLLEWLSNEQSCLGSILTHPPHVRLDLLISDMGTRNGATLVSWDQEFFDPIVINGKTLRTLRDAAEYITEPPKAEHDAD
jgi:hypothetical protein